MPENTPPNYRLADIPRGSYIDDGLTRIEPTWINEYILTREGEEAVDSAWRSIIPQWLELMRRELSCDYTIRESENFTVLLPLALNDQDAMIDHAERARALIMHYLEGIGCDDGDGKHVILCMGSQDDYYQYVSHYDPEGEYGAQTGMCLRDTGYIHMVLNHGPPWDQHQTITHELTHSLLSHLRLPIWVEEGLVQTVESKMHLHAAPIVPVADHREYWQGHTLAGYWLGSSFWGADDGQGLAYNLASLMVSQLMTESREKFVAFARSAEARDAGQDALLEHFGRPLSLCLPDFLRIEFAPPK